MENYKDLIEGLADGYVNYWDEDHFKTVTNDLWEERHTFPDLRDNFSYSLASCIGGLKSAYKLIAKEEYATTAKKMRRCLIQSAKNKGYFFRSFGELNDERTDASLLGLIWPFSIIDANSSEARQTVDFLMGKLLINDGLYRYEHDEYDGWMYRGFHRKKGAGYWPLLNFWLSIVLNKMGKREEALRIYYKVINDLKSDNYIPEQVFDNNIQKAVSPLCWSHVMFIFATKEFGLLDS